MGPNLIRFALLLLAAHAATAFASSPAARGQAKQSLGTVGSKTYYLDTRSATWSKAREHCEELGLRFATVTTKEEQDFLVSKQTTMGLAKEYWVNARDILTEKQFVWDNTLAPVELNGAGFMTEENPIHSAVTIYIASVTKKFIYKLKAAGSYNSVLCEG